MARVRKVGVATHALHVFSGLLGMTLVVCVFLWTYLPSQDLHPIGHPLDTLNVLYHDAIKPPHELLVAKKENRIHESFHEGGATEPHYYMVFSTDCSLYQDWQSYLFFFYAKKVGQAGTVTRIVSGCKESDRKLLQKFHDEKIAVMSDAFKIHFAPKCPDSRSKYFNKPYGLRDFMEKVLGYPNNKHDDDIIMIVDPDMMLLRPLTHKFDLRRIKWVIADADHYDTVEHGRPIAQTYAYGSTWITTLGLNASSIAGEDSPALHLSLTDASKRYPAGPPYLATARDMYSIAVHWTKFVLKVHDVFPKMMSEMHAYSFAAAHLKLPHQLTTSFMVSDVDCPDLEGWNFLEKVKREDACVPDAIPMEELPYVLHYCQRFALGRWFFGKHKMPKKFFDCESPLLREPSYDTAAKYDWYLLPNGKDVSVYTKKPFRILQNGWAMCRMIQSLNEVAVDYKTKYCPKDSINLDKSFIFHKSADFEAFLGGDVPALVLERYDH